MTIQVLIAEDEPHIVELLSFILNAEGYEVSAALDAEAALRSLRGHRPDILILDLMLPRGNGFEVLKQIRADPELRSLPVIVLTAKGQARDRRLAEEIGVDAFMTKPFANREIIEQIRRLTGP